MEAFYAEAVTTNLAFWQEADIDTRYVAGDQTVFNDLYYGNLPANRRKQFNFNRIRRIVNMISGYQRRNRKSTIVTPIENGDEATANQFTKILMWANQQEGILETLSDAFESGAITTGMNLLHVWLDYRSDPVNGNIRVDKCDYNYFLIDPFFKKADLSDCNSIWKRSFLSKRECISLLPNYKEEILGLYSPDTGRDGKFQFTSESYGYSYKNLLTYDEFYYKDFRSQRMLVDTQTGETMEWRIDDEDKLKLFIQTYPTVKVIDQDIPTVKLAIVVQGKVIYDDVNPMGIDTYPFVSVLGYYAPQLPYWPQRIQGVVRGLRDAQYLYNRRRIIELDILESQLTSGFIYKENSLVDPRDVHLSGQGKGLALKEEAQMTDVIQIQPPQVPPSMIQLSELLAKEVMEISGVNEELIGSASDDKAGILSMLRQGAGLTTLQGLFDQLDYAQKQLGKLMINIIQNNFTPGKVKRIIEEDPTPEFYNKNFGRYDCAIEEGLNTTTQRQMQFAQLLQLREVGVPIPDDVLLEAVTIQDKEKLIQGIQRNQQAQQEQAQQQAQLQMQELQANIELAQARAAADRGLGLERASRVAENQALAQERMSESVKDDNQALLNFVKAMKEIESIDIQQLEKLITLQAQLKQESQTAQNRSEPVVRV
jgi:hypothetical protein